jgi:5'-nucleotidase / UDP-sugar diphosphatase
MTVRRAGPARWHAALARAAAWVVALAAGAAAAEAPARPAPADARVVTLVAFSDYHSHALPFYSEGLESQGGIARAIAYFRAAKSRPGTLVLSGGDMLNKGTPTWSDEYRCVEWPWLRGLVDAMALGNHDLDYGLEEFERCRASVGFPVLAANLVRADGSPWLGHEGRPYLVRTVSGLRLGFFAVGGPDVQRLVKPEALPPGARWVDGIEAARVAVARLRSEEKVNAVVAIGHQLREDDFALARAVPGIDLILGTHAHYRGELEQIPGTATRYVSPYQYLAYVSEVRLRFEDGRLAGIDGGLVRMDGTRPEDPSVAAEVARLQRALEAKRPERFAVLGRAAVELSDAGLNDGESVIGNWATDLLRAAAGTQAFFATASGFRGAIPPGDVTAESFYAAIPYQNRLVRCRMSGRELLDLLATSVSKRGSDGFSQSSGVRYAIEGGRPIHVQVLLDAANPAAGFAPLDSAASYSVGTTDFQAYVAAGYKERFGAAAELVKTELDAHETLIRGLQAEPVAPGKDGRSGPR